MFGNGKWEQKVLGEVGTFKRGGGFQKSDYVECGIPCIHYGQIHTKYGPFIHSHISEISQFIEMFGDPLSEDKIWPKDKLGNICLINPNRDKNIEDSLPVSFIPMQDVNEDGTTERFEIRAYHEVKKGFTFCTNGDVLFAKITPCMENGKGSIMSHLENGIGLGSTEFHVLRPIQNKTNSTWLYCLTKLDCFRQYATHFMTGTGGQKRVPADYLKDFEIGVPPFELQNQFAAIFQQADKSKFIVSNRNLSRCFSTVNSLW